MEIISKVIAYTGFAPFIIFFVAFIVVTVIRTVWYDYLDEMLDDVLVIFACALFLASLACLVFVPTKHERYRVRVDNSVTVKELSETYEIIKYDRDTDLWLVEKRKEED